MIQTVRVRVWDAPVRIVHWLIVPAMPALWWTAEHDMMDWHIRIGLAVLGLVLFRIAWGFAGGSTARFASFLKGPRAVLAYAGKLRRGEHAVVVGHNPMGGWSVMGLITLLVVETALGLVATDTDGLYPGPLSRFLDYDTSRAATHWHHWLFNVLLALIGLHLAAIAFYALVKRDNLVGPMLSGARQAPDSAEPLRPAPLWRFALVALAAIALAVWIARGLK